MTFARKLLEHLGFEPDVDSSAGRAPFALTLTGGRSLEWREIDPPSASGIGFAGAFVADGLRAELSARCFDGSRGVEVSGSIHNEGSETFSVDGCSTVRLFLGLDGDWAEPVVRSWRGVRLIPTYFSPDDFAAEDRQLLRMPLASLPLAFGSGADGRSSSQDLPFVVLAGKRGGLALGVEWSGTWFAGFHQESSVEGETRRVPMTLEAGLWQIDLAFRPGEALPLPPVLLLPFEGDVAEGGNALRRHVRRHVMPQLGGQEVMPFASFNHYFAFQNLFTDSLLRPAVDATAAAGLDYFVVDAGWFPGGFRAGIGNWDEVDAEKFPDGVESFSRYVQEKGMQYGTWFEPEFAHVDSGLYRARPEWFFPEPVSTAYTEVGRWWRGRAYPGGLSGYRMLDFGLAEVQQYWVDRITSAYEDWSVRWIRWDFNQGPLSHWYATKNPGWAQIRHVHGLYRVFDHLLGALPDLVMEQCASGGHRIDLGTVRRGHTYWMNDHTTHTDVVRRLQTRLNHVLPGNYANTNLCQPRHDFTDYDFLSHGCGSFGYSGRLWEGSADDLCRYAEAVSRFKGYRHLLLGDYSFELDDPENRFGHEVHRWRDGGRELVIEFNGPDGARTASATVD